MGTFVYTYEYGDLKFELEYEFEKGEESTYDYPGSPDVFKIQSIKLDENELYHIIDEKIKGDMLEQIELNHY